MKPYLFLSLAVISGLGVVSAEAAASDKTAVFEEKILLAAGTDFVRTERRTRYGIGFEARQQQVDKPLRPEAEIRPDSLERDTRSVERFGHDGVRPDRQFGRPDLQQSDRLDRPDRPDRIDKPDRVDRPDRPDRIDKPDRVDRPDRPDRIDKPDRVDKPDRPQRPDRGR